MMELAGNGMIAGLDNFSPTSQDPIAMKWHQFGSARLRG
jgi:hypothetical protein